MFKLLGASGLVLSLLVLPFYVGYNQDYRSRATVDALGIGTSSLPTNDYNVISIAYYPPDATDPTKLDSVETGWESGTLISNWKTATARMLGGALAVNTEATKFRGYSRPSALPYLNYKVAGEWSYDEKIPRGNLLDASTDTYRPDYKKVLDRVNICDQVDNKGVREVWMWGYHSRFIVPDESRMSSKYGDISNALPKEEFTPVQFRMPICSKAYVLYNFTYQPGGGNGNDIHNRLHQLENVVFYAENKGYPADNTNTVGSMFWDDFSIYRFPNNTLPAKNSCGNTHSPPNTTDGYIYGSKNSTLSNCETWDPDDSKTTYINLNCDRWGCSDLGFYKWFMQSIPGYENGITSPIGCKMRNWWDLFLDFNAFVEKGRTLWECAAPASTPTPTTIPVTPTPALVTPTVGVVPTPNLLGGAFSIGVSGDALEKTCVAGSDCELKTNVIFTNKSGVTVYKPAVWNSSGGQYFDQQSGKWITNGAVTYLNIGGSGMNSSIKNGESYAVPVNLTGSIFINPSYMNLYFGGSLCVNNNPAGSCTVTGVTTASLVLKIVAPTQVPVTLTPTLTPTAIPTVVPTATPTTAPTLTPTLAPVISFAKIFSPSNGQTLDLEGSYIYVAEKVAGPTNYEWKIEQFGKVLHTEIKDVSNGYEFGLHPGSTGHNLAREGTITTSVRLMYSGAIGPWNSISNILKTRYPTLAPTKVPTSTPTLAPVPTAAPVQNRPTIKKFELKSEAGSAGAISLYSFDKRDKNTQIIVYGGYLLGQKEGDRYQVYICSSKLGKCLTSTNLIERVGKNGSARFRSASFSYPTGSEYNEVRVWSVGSGSKCTYSGLTSKACFTGK